MLFSDAYDCYERSFIRLTTCTFDLYCSMRCVMAPLKQYDDYDYDDDGFFKE